MNTRSVSARHPGSMPTVSRRAVLRRAGAVGLTGGVAEGLGRSGHANAFPSGGARAHGSTRAGLASVETIGSSDEPGALRQTIGSASGLSLVVAAGFWAIGDGGGGTFAWSNDTTAPDDGGTIIVPTKVGWTRDGCWRRLVDGPLSVKWFGAKGDGSDDRGPIQGAIDALGGQAGRGAVVIPSGMYVLGSSLLLAGENGITVRGDGPNKTMLAWNGPENGAMVLMENCRHCTISDLTLAAGNINYAWGRLPDGSQRRAGAAIECRSVDRSVKGYPVPTRNRFVHLLLDGYSPDRRGFVRGIRLTADAGYDRNNDHNTFLDCLVQHCLEAGFSMEHGQCRANDFSNCGAAFAGHGVSTGEPNGLGTQLQSGGGFKWFGGGFSGNRHDVLLGPPNEAIIVAGAVSEQSEHFLSMQTSSRSTWPVAIESIYFDTSKMPREGFDASGRPYGVVMDLATAGPVSIRGCQIGTQQSTADGAPTRAVVRHNLYLPTGASAANGGLVSIGNVFATDEIDGAAFDPYLLVNPLASVVSLGNILMVDPGGTYRSEALPTEIRP